jgi:tetratricopeptide (TPR) repeat protein
VLFAALEQVDDPAGAFAVLDRALELRPDDGDLLLTAANAHARYARFDTADDLLGRAKDRCRPAAWLRGSAEVATFRGDADRARDLWRQVLAHEPLALDAHRHLAVLLAQAGGSDPAIDHLRTACDRFPHNLPLRQLLLAWLADEGAAAAEPDVRRHLDLHPTDTQARRQLAWALAARQQLDEAEREADEAVRTDPTDPASHHVRGKVLAAQGRTAEARAAYRRAIEISVDADYAIADLVGCCDGAFARRQELEFVREQLVRQTLFGDGLLAFRAVASDTLEPEELLRELRTALAARPDLWHAHAAVVRQLIEMNRLDEAAAAGRDAVARFPLLSRLWFDLAQVYRYRNETDAELAALGQAQALAPGWTAVARQMAEAHERQGDLTQARKLLEAAVARDPLEVRNHGCWPTPSGSSATATRPWRRPPRRWPSTPATGSRGRRCGGGRRSWAGRRRASNRPAS